MICALVKYAMTMEKLSAWAQSRRASLCCDCYRAHGVIETHHDKQSDQATTVIAENVEANTTTVPATGKLGGDHKHATKEDDKTGQGQGGV